MRAILCIDPGESTGVAWGILNERAPSAIQAVHDRIESGSMTITGSEPEQIRALSILWSHFKRRAVNNHMMPPDTVDLVIEDFVLFPGEKPGRATTTPERIAWGFEGYRMAQSDGWRKKWPKHYTPVTWQKSGAAHRFKQRDILTRADAWVVGKDHERSAFAHMILRTNVLMDKLPPRGRRIPL